MNCIAQCTKLMARRLEIRVLDSQYVSDQSHLYCVQRDTPSFLFAVCRELFYQELERPTHESDHSAPPGVEVQE
jgi:hypothetical protein